MDFFEQQARAHRKTKWLVLYFAVAVALIIAMLYWIVLLACYYCNLHAHHYDVHERLFYWWDAKVFLGATVGTLAVILGGCAYKINELAEGGSALAQSLGGRLVSGNTADPDERKLLNVVEEMAIASAVPVPQVYVLDEEMGINAFAAGHTTSDAVIAVTHGAMKLLTRDELQGVIGHEFSHILNGDMRLNIRLIGILFGILCIAAIGRGLMNTSGSSRRSDGRVVLVGLVLFIIGSIGVFFGRLIQAAVSRQREFLADASSVQFTRNPLGLSGALQKIGGYGFSSWLTNENAPDAGHLFFGNGNSHLSFGLMATHPPLDERIRVIDSSWDGKFPRVDRTEIEAEIHAIEAKRAKEPRAIFEAGKMIILGGTAAQATQPVKKYALPSIGNPTPLHLKYAEAMRESLPDSVKAAAREPLDSAALIFSMLLADDEKLRADQIAEIAKRFLSSVSEKTAALFPDVSKAALHAHLPMVSLALGSLRRLTADEFTRFSQTLQWLIESDGKIELYEFVLQKIVMHHLAPQFGQAPRATVEYYSLKPLVPDCTVLLSALANVGSNDTAEVQKAFDAGAPYLRAQDDSGLQLLPREQCGVTEIDPALNRLAQSAPQIKKNLLEACIHVIGADGVILEGEAELLRAIADTLDCPMPPMMMAE
jgi:Zn-dependent protease with chaperone function